MSGVQTRAVTIPNPMTMTTTLRAASLPRCAAAIGLIVPAACLAGGVPTVELEALNVSAQSVLDGRPGSATEGQVTAEQLALRPISRNGELLEFLPGLIVTQHSGEGKANQYFLRGFNLDHGTDFYTEVDGLPVNMRSHAHGQGYADINFIIPELIGSLEYRKGTYYADVGDFSAAGSANLRYVDALPQSLINVTGGSHDYYNLLAASSPKWLGGDLLLGAEGTLYNGPFIDESKQRKLAGIARWNRGDAREGLTIGLQGYAIRYNASDQIPLRAVEAGTLDRYGFLDPSDGGSVHRFSLNAEWRHALDDGHLRGSAYALDYRLSLYSNFTYFLDNPVEGDQFEQAEHRQVYGLAASRYWTLPTPVPADVEIGLQSRFDDISPIGLYKTHLRDRLATVREDAVQEGSLSAYLRSRTQWTRWFRSELGYRVEGYHFDVRSDTPANSGTRTAAIGLPKLALVFGPWARTQLFLDFGEGFHSNDARGVTLRVDPADKTTPVPAAPPLVRARGMEFGLTTAVVPDVKLTASVYALRLNSELVYSGDAGASDPSGASRRYGYEFSAYWQPLPWLAIDGDYARAHARLDSPDGDRIPNALDNVFAFGITVPDFHRFSGGLRVRHLGGGALIEDNRARSQSTTVVSAQLGYRFLDRYRASFEVLNLLDSRRNDITYYYASRLPGEPAQGIEDYHFHPIEPRLFRLSLSTQF